MDYNKKLDFLKIELFEWIDFLAEKTKQNFSFQPKTVIPKTTVPVLEKFLQRRGYFQNKILDGSPIWTKDFTCVRVLEREIMVWHDIPNSKPLLIKESFLTGLPITLKYMERI
jgi:hypothetical protein